VILRPPSEEKRRKYDRERRKEERGKKG